jgi:molecular chaperone DnaK (HSP70)
MARVGIDYGTTNTVAVFSDRGHYPVVPHAVETAVGPISRDVFPSLAVYDRVGGRYEFGLEAERCLLRPGAESRYGVIRSLKRRIRDYAEGRLADSEAVPGGFDPARVLRGCLESVRDSVRRSGLVPQGEPLEAVITWPAHANGAQRHLTRRCFREAGFPVAGALTEPAAAAIEFADRMARGHRVRARQLAMTIAVFDLGGGTFDVSLVRIEGPAFTVLGSAGIERLGGDDFDDVLARRFAQRLGVGFDALAPYRRNLLLAHARQQKESIADGNVRSLTLAPEDIGLSGNMATVTVAEYFAELEPLLAPAIDRLEKMAAAHAGPLDAVYLVGGSSRLPLVGALLDRRLPGARRIVSDKPFTAVAMGAAIHSTETVHLHDVLSRTFGVIRLAERGSREVFSPVFPGGMPLPRPGAPAVETTIEYTPRHNIGHLRYLECASVDAAGRPAEGVRAWSSVLFPYDPRIPVGTPLRSDQIVYREDLAGQRIRETYSCDADGVITVRVARGIDGQACTYEVFRG